MDKMLIYSIESFPPLPETINRLSRLCDEHEPNIKKITALIESDPILHTNLLHFGNAPFHGLKNPIKKISQVISLFGVQTIKGVALCSAIKGLPYIDVSPYHISVDQWFKTMQNQSRFISLWINQLDNSYFERIGAVMHFLEIGRLISSYALMFTENPYHFSKTDPKKLQLEEINILGASGDELAAALFERWNFDSELIDHLRYSLNPELAKDPQLTAILTCARLLYTPYGIVSIHEIEPFINTFHFDMTLCLAAYNRTNQGEP